MRLNQVNYSRIMTAKEPWVNLIIPVKDEEASTTRLCNLHGYSGVGSKGFTGDKMKVKESMDMHIYFHVIKNGR